jgi:hypothetical protein
MSNTTLMQVTSGDNQLVGVWTTTRTKWLAQTVVDLHLPGITLQEIVFIICNAFCFNSPRDSHKKTLTVSQFNDCIWIISIPNSYWLTIFIPNRSAHYNSLQFHYTRVVVRFCTQRAVNDFTKRDFDHINSINALEVSRSVSLHRFQLCRRRFASEKGEKRRSRSW